VNVVMNLQVPQNAGNVACFFPGRAKDLSAPLYCKGTSIAKMVTVRSSKKYSHPEV
jgi:hypothetical protein